MRSDSHENQTPRTTREIRGFAKKQKREQSQTHPCILPPCTISSCAAFHNSSWVVPLSAGGHTHMHIHARIHACTSRTQVFKRKSCKRTAIKTRMRSLHQTLHTKTRRSKAQTPACAPAGQAPPPYTTHAQPSYTYPHTPPLIHHLPIHQPPIDDPRTATRSSYTTHTPPRNHSCTATRSSYTTSCAVGVGRTKLRVGVDELTFVRGVEL